jgi:hypothetical protein
VKALRAVACAAALQLLAGAVQAEDASADATQAAALRARYATLKDQQGVNPFQRPIYLESSEGANEITGEAYALINYPFAVARPALNQAAHWCDILILHLNTKYCHLSTRVEGTFLQVNIGKKFDQPLKDAYRVDFNFRVTADSPNFLQVKMNADQGPLSTSDYRIVLEATPAEEGKTFIRLSYSYSYGMMGRLAMQLYLGTIGRNKVGFTVVDKEPNGDPSYIRGMRGIVERNTMRYYLAIESYLGALASPPQARVEKSLHDWFSAIELYPRQLHEMEQGEYLAMKRSEYSRQQTAQVSDVK